MMWRLLAILAACSAPVAHVAAPGRHHDEQLRVAPSGSPIAVAAVTDDGTAAVTGDSFGGIRLWPTLDGTREPLSVPGPAPRELAIVHDAARAFGLAIVDDAGTLTVVTIDASNRLRGERQVATVAGVTATADALVAWLPDGTIETIDLGGNVTATAVAPGHLVSVAARGTRILAAVDSRRGMVGYWLEHGRIGAATPVLPFDSGPVVLATDGAHVAGMRERAAIISDVATGTDVAHSRVCDPIGFVDRDTLACRSTAGNEAAAMVWVSVGGTTTVVDLTDDSAVATNKPHEAPALHAVGDGVAVADHSSSLELLAPGAAPSFLGYGVVQPSKVRSTPRGLAISGAGRWGLLDERLAYAGTFVDQPIELVPDAIAVDAHTPLALHVEITGTELRRGDDIIFRDVFVDNLVYEPATKLAAVVLAHGVGFFHVDSGEKTQVTFDLEDAEAQVHLLDPALAGGKVALLEHAGRVAWLSAGELSGSVAWRPAGAWGNAAAIDRAGRPYRILPTGVVVGEHAFANTRNAVWIAPDATGARVAISNGTWVALFRDDGRQLWRISIVNARPIWQGDRLFLVTSTPVGLARLDLATGAFAERACAWRFGRFDAPTPPIDDDTDSLCTL
ncbi:MAG TPA: hypothetical protein VGG74_28110 [Kofleriaceae bacterium]|jgi:hypothetical protein